MTVRRFIAILVLAQLIACASGVSVPASSPEAFNIPPGSAITLHTRNGDTVRGEYTRDDGDALVLDDGRVLVSKSEIASVEMDRQTLRSRPKPTGPKKPRSDSWIVLVVAGWAPGVAGLVATCALIVDAANGLHGTSFKLQ
jgi:hypothetical protein